MKLSLLLLVCMAVFGYAARFVEGVDFELIPRPDDMPLAADDGLEDVQNSTSADGAHEDFGAMNIIIGNQKQHVGDVRGPTMMDVVWDAIEWLCPRQGDPEYGRPDNWCRQEICYKHDKVPYNAKGKFATNAHLIICIGRFYFDPLLGKSRDHIQEMVAATFKVQTMDAKNCYSPSLKDGSKHTWCNTAEYVRMHMRRQPLESRLQVDLKFNGRTDEGHFDCVAILEATHRYYDIYGIAGAVKKDLGTKDVDATFDCPKREVTRGTVDDSPVE